MNHTRFVRRLRNTWLVALLTLSSMALAVEKSYTVTAPDGVRLAVQESGDPTGQAVIFIHGLLGSRMNWEKQIDSPQLQRYRMITYDLRGHGLSDKPENIEAYRNGRRYADDLATVLEATAGKRPVLVGWSLGGVVISNYLAAYGDAKISGIVYVDAVIELNAALITAHPHVYAGLSSDDLKTHLDALRTFLGLCFQIKPDAPTFERLLSSAAMASWTMTRATPAMTVDVAEGLPKAKVPVLMLYGSKDDLVNVQPSIARARQLNARIQSKVYENSGHAPFLEEASRFNTDLAAFMDSAAIAAIAAKGSE
ncbi:Pimeloyl-ACP methyl ester carboxylesterase [Pseudomonas congelans]|uniref:Alpha/beta hydrolase n=1 Tax=Pseudomonas congelans TaxID=200452 RepID=A0A0P9LY56_9PSED|nr:alpha/beta hydrolase [Pseudomonas congelans]KPW83560.1 Alpha/beta hydrolase [Pseudomonas congelans]SDO73198.1 Pimeloyl-ACP methyl ester carboxylesterase [Pseudomonas congelans]